MGRLSWLGRWIVDQIAGVNGLHQFGPTEAVGPDLHHAAWWALEAEQLEGKYHSFEEELLGTDAAQYHHPIAGIAVTARHLGHD